MINKTIYRALALNREAYTELLGMWLGQNESAAFWQGLPKDFKAADVEGILVTVTHILNGLTQSIINVFHRADTQICGVHQIRNSAPYGVWKDKKALTTDRKHLYNAPNKEMTEEQLNRFEKQSNHKDPSPYNPGNLTEMSLRYFLTSRLR